jgi:tetratricopeptide (TPR) repeat protein
MIRGQLALHRGDARKAIEHLEQAVKLLPHSVAAHSLLAQAYVADGQGDRSEIIFMDSIEKLPAVTPEDYLFKGDAESWADPARALEDLNEAIRRRDSTISRVLRASARASVAYDTGNIDMAQSSIEDASTAKNMMPGNPFAIGTDLYVHLVAMALFRDAGDNNRADVSLLQAGKDAQVLKQFRALPLSYEMRWHYLSVTGQEETAYEVARDGYQETKMAWLYVYSLYERGEFEKALQVFGVHDVVRSYILAELPDGPSRALEAYKKNCELFTIGYWAVWNQATPLLLGRRTEAMTACKELRQHPELLTDLNRGHYLRILDYCGGRISEEELLKAETGSRWNQCESHFYVALDRLGQGDRTGAREHFQKTLATRVLKYVEYQWSRLFLKRMDQDPTWPKWIPPKEPTTQPTTTP